jgi:hypothetical protein
VAGQLGLYAVGQLAAGHGISVMLTESADGGTTAQVRLPAALLAPGPGPAGQPAVLDTGPAGLPAAAPAELAATEAGQPAAEAAGQAPADLALTLAAPVPEPAPDDEQEPGPGEPADRD